LRQGAARGKILKFIALAICAVRFFGSSRVIMRRRLCSLRSSCSSYFVRPSCLVKFLARLYQEAGSAGFENIGAEF
jgi:hypothetical protein